MDISQTLESIGYEVPSIFATAEEALGKIFEIKPDLVLIDIVLKGKMNGIELAGRLKEFDIPVVYLTAISENNLIERAKLTEPYGYITKPFHEEKLKQIIKKALYKHETDKKHRMEIQA
jgi:CheY-like chemotaxis protein